MEARHEPVMVDEVLTLLAPEQGRLLRRLHAWPGRSQLRRCSKPGAGRLLGSGPRRGRARIARERLAPFADRVELVHCRLPRAPRRARRARHRRGRRHPRGPRRVVDAARRARDAASASAVTSPSTCGWTGRQGPTAADLMADADEDGARRRDLPVRRGAPLAPRRARDRRARAERTRSRRPARSPRSCGAPCRRAAYQRIDPATRTFQALRIWVNRELDGLDTFLGDAARRLLAGARFAVITFHSLEDRIVKHTFRRARGGRRRPARADAKRRSCPATTKCARNPRARSAKLRAIERLA